MHSLILLLLLSIVSSCSSSRPTRPSFGSGGASAVPGGGGTKNLGGTTDLSFSVVDSRSMVRISSAEILINKLKTVTSLDNNSTAVKEALSSRSSLGAYDFAQGVLPESKWTVDKMGTWYKVADQACRDSKLLAKIQEVGGDKEFLEAAYGREIESDEASAFKDIPLTGARRARVICTAILTSGEFVAL